DQKTCQFQPHVQLARMGSRMLISNSDDALHNFHITMNGVTIENEAQPPGVPPREVTLKKPGVNMVNCDVHPWMRGFVIVADNPYNAITDADGHYTLSNVPAGKYTINLWRDNWMLDQPKGPNGVIAAYKWGPEFTKSQEVKVDSNGQTVADFVLP